MIVLTPQNTSTLPAPGQQCPETQGPPVATIRQLHVPALCPRHVIKNENKLSLKASASHSVKVQSKDSLIRRLPPSPHPVFLLLVRVFPFVVQSTEPLFVTLCMFH